ncbi:MAG: selenocysteine-specific translation elongation factor [Tissierellia bacterium]|jgi:selenocysteine-specific elongation factor|nr:selenocysteine-specific translation elongation factor [Tissierellia bacterium]
MKHIIIGTAGHIDHGKTTLIRAITGRNTDRLKEEQDRGISIELGFTYFDLPSGQRAGIIDVPGHEKFIKSMLAGVIGIDIVLLVVAADEGIMPQTTEHLAILDLLGIKKGFVVLTKSDLVDEEWIELVEEEIQEELINTFLEGSPIVRVSSTKGEGIEQVTELVDKYTAELDEKDYNDMPRLPVDRVFSISGFGTIVTGTLLSGQFKTGEEVQIYPGDKKARIRSLQVHDNDVEIAYGGQRVAVNLAGTKKEDLHRGSMIAPVNAMIETMMLDVKIKLLKSLDREIENRTRLKLYLGTKEVLCRLVLLDKEVLIPGEEAYAQLRLEEEVVAKRGDKFILRFYSPMFTIGGGEVLESNPAKRKRFDEDIIKELEIKEYGDTKDIIENIIEEKSKNFPSIKELSSSSSTLEENLKEEVEELSKEGKVLIFSLTKELYPIHINYFNHIKTKIINELSNYHKVYPLRTGMSMEEIRSKYLKNAKTKVAEKFMDMLIDQGDLAQVLESIKLSSFKIEYNEEQTKIKKDIIYLLDSSAFLPPKKEEIAKLLEITKAEFEEVFNNLLSSGEIIKINDELFLLDKTLNTGIEKIKSFIKTNGSITIGQCRDLLGANRKVTLGILEYLDGLKITKRDEEKRTLIIN